MTDNALTRTADAGAAGIAGLSFLGYLPSIAAALSILWLCIQIGTWVYRQFKGQNG
jgi:hypothetical protein